MIRVNLDLHRLRRSVAEATEGRFRCQVFPCGTGTGYPPPSSVSPVSTIPPLLHSHPDLRARSEKECSSINRGALYGEYIQLVFRWCCAEFRVLLRNETCLRCVCVFFFSPCCVVKESAINRCRASELSAYLLWFVFGGYGMNESNVLGALQGCVASVSVRDLRWHYSYRKSVTILGGLTGGGATKYLLLYIVL